ncbi:sigma-54 interaction domain-containing protein [Aliiglaciecola aliphaticivorans]
MEANQRQTLQYPEKDEFEDKVIGENAGLFDTLRKASLVAPTDTTVLILGETGSGKEVIARRIHCLSERKKAAFVRVNCGAISPELVDSELFGHERGSFSGAEKLRRGWFERANGGTLFLDEVGELSMQAQVRLLRVLQEGTLTRVGGEADVHVNVRIIAATHRNLAEMVAAKNFREDLWYRLNVFPIYLPSLRERIKDIPELAEHMVRRASIKLGLPPVYPNQRQLQALVEYSWPGNVREIQVVIERALILGRGKTLELDAALGKEAASVNNNRLSMDEMRSDAPVRIATLNEVIQQHIVSALHAANGRVEGRLGAAQLLGLNPNTLRSKMRKLGIKFNRIPVTE